MNQPTLVIMAAGMGSRFGGLKQITPVDAQGHIMIDYSLYDAYRAGFRKIVFIIKHEIESEFKEKIGRRMERFFDVTYVFQKIETLPAGFSVPKGRTKLWGTGHAVACAKDAVDSPFAVINADDFYGATAFSKIFSFLTEHRASSEYAMVGYALRNTVTESGSVSRGCCQVKNGLLQGVVERTKIYKRGRDAAYTEDGDHFEPISGDTIVSMNFWGFQPEFLNCLWEKLPAFLHKGLRENPEKCEFYLPSVADELIHERRAIVKVLETDDTWYGITYSEDLPVVRSAIASLKQRGAYPEQLWQFIPEK